MKLRICALCDCDQMKKQDNGWLVCTQCNSVDESYQEVELDYDDYSKQAKVAMATELNDDNTNANKHKNRDNDIPWTLLEAFQVIILYVLVVVLVH